MNNLKISINVQNKEGPWGGGNLFISNLKNYLESNGNEVIFNLFDPNIDIILIIDPRMLSESVMYTPKEIEFYKRNINNKCKVVHRINECDERKETSGINEYYIKANNVADHTVFVSEWLKNIYINSGFSSKNFDVIMSGANSEIFNYHERAFWNKNEPLRIVTHHWGSNFNKGFDIYSYLDKSIQEKYKNQIKFTYIGNLNKDLEFQSTEIIEPKSGRELANLIKENHIYLTASINEPSGNHHIEAAQCGLPILYRDSGGMPEFTKGFGVEFQGKQDFFESLDELKNNYLTFFEKMKEYPFNSLIMSKEYLELFNKLALLSPDPYLVDKNILFQKSFLQKFFYFLNKLLNNIKLYKLKVRIKKYLLIKIPVLKNERNVV
ncbi:MAG: hypothetical protein CMP16_04485 [Rickettsiales bacterium]|nr:hypothetical protein [Rickettsiales bacterium]|tara:strand:- start:1336 stop:2475 length:1140 start_codon:yes stop_codon:yes gene_type:complete